jgi:hypothetical protein
VEYERAGVLYLAEGTDRGLAKLIAPGPTDDFCDAIQIEERKGRRRGDFLGVIDEWTVWDQKRG